MSRAQWEEGKSTRSGLLWEVERILSELPKEQLPDVLLMENVPQVHAEANKADFDLWLAYLRSRGYQNFWRDLNARDYGIPQNRDRCFCVSILSEDFIDYEFPNPIPLEKVMNDYLEESVEEKYYINSPKARELIDRLIANGTLESKKKLLATTDNRLCGRLICASRDRKKSLSQTASAQGRTEESVTISRKEAVFVRGWKGTKMKPEIRLADVACTICAGESHGMQNLGDNAVVEEGD